MKMISNDLRSSCRAMLLGAYQGGRKETEAEWTYPDEWPTLPDAGKGEVILLIRPWSERSKICLKVGSLGTAYVPEGYIVTIDWGDGDVLHKTDFPSSSELIEHEYSADYFGKYVLIRFKSPEVEITQNDEIVRVASGLNGLGKNSAGYLQSVLAACVGKRAISFDNGPGFGTMYVRFMADDFNKTTMSTSLYYISNSEHGFSGEYRQILYNYIRQNTKRVDFIGKPEYLGGYGSEYGYSLCTVTGLDKLSVMDSSVGMFKGNYALKKLSLPELTEVPSAFFTYNYSLEEIHLPKCTKVCSSAFSNNYALRKVVLSANCEIDSTAFANNYQYVEIIMEESI